LIELSLFDFNRVVSGFNEMFKQVKNSIKEAIGKLEFLMNDGLSLSNEWIRNSVDKVKDLRKKALKSSFEIMKIKKLLFENKKGKITFDFEVGKETIHVLSVKLLTK
jgi:hypothetical protein